MTRSSVCHQDSGTFQTSSDPEARGIVSYHSTTYQHDEARHPISIEPGSQPGMARDHPQVVIEFRITPRLARGHPVLA